MIEVSVDDFLTNIDYTKDYFLKILRECNVPNRYLLYENDLELLCKFPVTTNKSYKLRLYLYNLLRDKPSIRDKK